MVVQIDGGPPLEHHEGGDEGSEDSGGGEPGDVKAGENSHGAVQRGEGPKDNGGLVEAFSGQVCAEGRVDSCQSCGIAQGGVVCCCVEAVQMDEPWWGRREEDVRREAEDVLGA